MTHLLEEVHLVASSIMYAPENLLDGYNKDLYAVDRRLSKLLVDEHSAWVSFDSCLQQARQ